MTSWYTPDNAEEEIKTLTNRDFIRHLMVRKIKLSCPECGNENFFTVTDIEENKNIQLVHSLMPINSSHEEPLGTPVIISTCDNCGYCKFYNAYAVLNTKYEFSRNQSFPKDESNE
ncbi:hypothetical protein [Klebsiella pneumoniae]|uniref:hypothetical protein n=1 Tax=Klebsiella pneumoniae TaxID=573 RepID=UPI0011E4DCBF|nr:hypothetical protein [Klebsiella pneumoniae]